MNAQLEIDEMNISLDSIGLILGDFNEAWKKMQCGQNKGKKRMANLNELQLWWRNELLQRNHRRW